jgi:prepilin-type N-terminal cleavage/methylation domain-containing protein
MKNSKGFSLLELLIVVAIILIIATIAIPSLLRSRQAANESAAVANLRTINTAQVTYLSSAAGKYGDLPDLIAAKLLDDTFTGTKAGYNYSVNLDATSFRLHHPGRSGFSQHRSLWLLQRSGRSGSLFDERFACSGRSVRTFRPVNGRFVRSGRGRGTRYSLSILRVQPIPDVIFQGRIQPGVIGG